MEYITSSEIDTIDGVEYLHLYLNPKFGFKIKVDGEELDQNELYIKAPTLNSADIYDIKKCCTIIAKFEEVKNEKLAKELTKLNEEELNKLQTLYKDVEETSKEMSEDEKKKAAREHILSILKTSKSYEVERSDFFTEFDKVIFFIEKRAYRAYGGSAHKIDFKIFDEHLAQKQFLLEAIYAEYVAFFFKHFPLESLSFLSGK